LSKYRNVLLQKCAEVGCRAEA
jgi:hypothetical protein